MSERERGPRTRRGCLRGGHHGDGRKPIVAPITLRRDAAAGALSHRPRGEGGLDVLDAIAYARCKVEVLGYGRLDFSKLFPGHSTYSRRSSSTANT
jgi:hypothetical protein